MYDENSFFKCPRFKIQCVFCSLEQHNILFTQTSALDATNVEEAFQKMITGIIMNNGACSKSASDPLLCRDLSKDGNRCRHCRKYSKIFTNCSSKHKSRETEGDKMPLQQKIVYYYNKSVILCHLLSIEYHFVNYTCLF